MDETDPKGPKPHNRRAKDERSLETNSSPKHAESFQHQIDCLKVLTLTLLREIESLENVQGDTSAFDLSKETRRFESEMIRSALIKTGGRQRRAARLLGMKVTTLNTKIRRYRIKIDETTVAE